MNDSEKTLQDVLGRSMLTLDLRETSLDLRRYGLERAKLGEKYAFQVDHVEAKFISFKLVKLDK